MVYLLYDLSGAYLVEFRSYVDEIKLSLYIVGFYYLIRILVTLCSKSNLLSQVDVLIDDFIYGNLSQEAAFEILTICQYGLNLKKVIQRELDEYLTNKAELERHLSIIKEMNHEFENNHPTEIDSRMDFLTATVDSLTQEIETVRRFQASLTNLNTKIKSIPILKGEEDETFNSLLRVLDDGIEKAEDSIKLVGKLLSDAQIELKNRRTF